MSTLRDGLLPVIDSLRALPSVFGLRRYTVTLRSRAWSGGAIGRGTATNTDTVLTPAPRVRAVTAMEVAQSAGTWREGDLRLDKITPQYTTPTTGGYTPMQLALRPPANGATDVCVILVGDEGPVEAQIVERRFDRAFGYSLIVRISRGVH